MSENRISLTLPGSADKLGDSLSALRKFVTEVSDKAGLEKPAMHRLRLAVDEIATNIILYGYQHADANTAPFIEAIALIDDDALTLSLEDAGAPFDPSQRELPEDLDAPLEERDVGGLGVYLAIENVDEFNYQRVGNRNRNSFVMKRH